MMCIINIVGFKHQPLCLNVMTMKRRCSAAHWL
jgi:hypothetical protein